MHPVEETAFGPLRITFDDRVLRPRHWTLAQSRWAADLCETVPPGPVLELCAGVGHIGLLAVRGTRRRLVSVDLSEVASSFTRRNAERAGLYGRVEVRTGDLREVLRPGEEFPLIVADPPWVPRAQTGTFPDDPLIAIDGGPDGMDVVHSTVHAIGRHLAPGGTAILQVGTLGQAEAVVEPAIGLGLTPVEMREEERGVLLRLDRVPPS